MRHAMLNTTKDNPLQLQERTLKISGKRRTRHLEPLTARDILYKNPPTKQTLQKMGKQLLTKQQEEPKELEKPKLKHTKWWHGLKPLFKTFAKAEVETDVEPKSPTIRDFKTWFPDVSEAEWLRLKALQAHRRVESVLGSSAVRCDESGNDLRALDQLDTEQHGVDNTTVVGPTEQHEEEKIDDVTFPTVQGAAGNNAGVATTQFTSALAREARTRSEFLQLFSQNIDNVWASSICEVHWHLILFWNPYVPLGQRGSFITFWFYT